MRNEIDSQIHERLIQNKKREAWDADSKTVIEHALMMGLEDREELVRKARDLACTQAPRTPTELWHAIHLLFGYKVPLTSTHPDFNAPFEWFSKAYFNVTDDSVALASRGSGKTLLGSILTAIKSIWNPGYEAVHAGGTQVQAHVASSYLNTFYTFPHFKPLFDGKPAKFSASWKNNSQFKIVTGSMKGVSGQHPILLTLDEIEFWEIEALTQTFEVPVNKQNYRRVWTAFSTRQRCLPGYTRILTEDGPMKISKVVRTRYAGKVKSFNSVTQVWEWKQVIDWYHNGSSSEWFKIYLEYTGLGRGCELIATKEHYVYYAPGKKKPLDQFVEGDCLCLPSWCPSGDQRQLLLGTLLGDACLSGGSLRVEHSSKQVNYLRWFGRAFKEEALPEDYNEKRDHYLQRLKVSPYLHRLQKEWYPDKVKRIPDYVWEELDERGLAVWLMDDGSYRKAGTNNGGDTWHIYCNHFNSHEREQMQKWFKCRGVYLTWMEMRPGQFYAYIGGAYARLVTEMVKAYIDVSTHLGVRQGWKRWVASDYVETGHEGIEQVPIRKIEVLQTNPQGCYDIAVEGNHNYCNGSNILVSNSYGCMNWLVDEAPKRGFSFFQWSVFEVMQPCITCEALDKEPYGDDEARECVCPLWEACRGERAKKSSGWLPLKDARDKCIRLGGPRGREWQTQGLCNRPSSHGLVLHNFEHTYRPDGNYTKWEYNPELPWYAVHDPAEGKKSVIYFLQIYDGMTFVFDELVDPLCPDVTTAKQAFYEHCLRMKYPDPEKIVVDPHRTDAVATWKFGSKSGVGILHSYSADVPDISEVSGVTQFLTKTIELLRQSICDGRNHRKLFINPEYCPHAVRGIKEYHYPTDKVTNDVNSDIPQKDYSDEVDPLRYWEMYRVTKLNQGGGRILVL